MQIVIRDLIKNRRRSDPLASPVLPASWAPIVGVAGSSTLLAYILVSGGHFPAFRGVSPFRGPGFAEASGNSAA
eukprot:11130987-Alexandrium_andersonii.AAC.1